MNKNIAFKKLLCNGLFPEKLSDIFSSEKFGLWIIRNGHLLTSSNGERFNLLTYRLTRSNNSPRYMGIPHPIGYYCLVKEIVENWEKIEKFFSPDFYVEKSMICPKIGNRKQRLISLSSYDKNQNVEQLLLDKQFGKKYLVHADIASCYPSVYTHTICWALAGKKVSKNNKHSKDKWYNKIDKACQNLQDGETRGLPIGPDTSNVLCEIILSRVDKDLKRYEYVRFIDDYTCSCKTKDEADKFLIDLSKSLDEFRLCLNVKKTKVLEYPRAINEDWVRKLRMAIDWQSIGYKEKDSVIGFLDLSSELFEKNPSESTIRFATQVLKRKRYTDYEIYKLVLRYFLNLSFLFPYILDTCDELILCGLNTFKPKRSEIKRMLEEALSGILSEHVKYKRSDAITWSLFLSIKFELAIFNFSMIEKKIIKIKDPISVLMSYLYKKSKKENIKLYKNLLPRVNENEWWLFVYEVSRIEKKRIANLNMENAKNANISFLSKEILSKI